MTPKRTRGGESRRVISLADQLRKAASESGLSVYRIAQATGVDQSTLNKFLTGSRDNLRLDMADRLYQFFFLPPRPKPIDRADAGHKIPLASTGGKRSTNRRRESTGAAESH